MTTHQLPKEAPSSFDEPLAPTPLTRGEALLLISAIHSLARKIKMDLKHTTFVPPPGKYHSGPARLRTLHAIKDKLTERLGSDPHSASATPPAGLSD